MTKFVILLNKNVNRSENLGKQDLQELPIAKTRNRKYEKINHPITL